MEKKILSIVAPVHNEHDTIDKFYNTIQSLELGRDITIEYVFADDGSTDDTLDILKRLHKMDSVVHYTSFSRNFGKEAGLYAGLQRSQGDYVTVMDVDLQDPPELLPQMLQLVREQKYDVVATRRANRKGEAIIRSWFSKQFYKVMNKISDVPLVDGARDYRIMTRQVVDSLLKLSENQRFSKGMFNWVGFKVKYISFENVPSSGGVSSWSFWSLSKYAVQGIVSFSTVPLTVITYIGITTFLMSIISAIFVVIRAVIYHNSASGWASMVTIMLFIGGIQLLSLGVIGRYLSSIFLEVKDRPIYITKEMDKN